ncbi:MAG: MCE family protein [Rhodospirillales bacterium]|nr:MCE family protein [Rhodospirillales bacterium]
MKAEVRETVIGAATFAGLALSYGGNQEWDSAPTTETIITARFNRVDGPGVGDDMRISGIKVGSVQDLRLDSQTYDAVVTMTVLPKVKIPVDTVASISSEGILGGKYIRLDPGREKTYLADGASLKKTKDFRSLEDQVGEIIFLATGGNKGG